MVLLCYLFLLPLRRSWLKARLACEGCLLRGRPRGYAVRPAIEAGVIVIDDRRVVDHRCIHIRRPNDGRVHVYSRCVVSELTTAPLTAGKSTSTVTISIIHAAVEADLRPPVTAIENIIAAVSPSPIARRPEIARLRSLYPCSSNPVVVALAVPGPIAWSPHVVGLRTGRLNVNRNSGWSDASGLGIPSADQPICLPPSDRTRLDDFDRKAQLCAVAHEHARGGCAVVSGPDNL